MTDILYPIAGFLSGSVPFSYLAGRFFAGRDVRREGSGNVGATNVFRVAGRGAGIAAVLGDVLKSLLPIAAARHFGIASSWQAATAAAVVLGHCYSPFLRFAGGKGVISTVIVSLVLCWQSALAFGAVWLGVFLARGYVSLASILGAAALAPAMALAGAPAPFIWFGGAVSAFVAWKHRTNIARLLAGTESRMHQSSR